MFIRKPNPLDPVGGTETPEAVALNRRGWMRWTGYGLTTSMLGLGGYLGWKKLWGSDREVVNTNSEVTDTPQFLNEFFPAKRDDRFEYGRAETDRAQAARYTNFYEFSRFKWNWRYVDKFQPYPWQFEVTGLCRQPLKLDLNDFHRRFAPELVERQYRHRCVERWAMAIPWSGVSLATVLEAVDPLPTATHVLFTSFKRPAEAAQQRSDEFPWPYTEGLTLPEAMNELALLASGMYGQPLLKQHGAPIRLVVPWKYGFKSIKSIERIELIDHEPPTFWSTLNPAAYPFESNVDPQVPRPWPQHQESMLGTNEVFPTQRYNGYEKYVSGLYVL
jgi:sulfoxide reductase catalytic subunit YedY